MEYERLAIEEIEDLTQRACVQLVPELTTKLLSMAVELIEYKKKTESGTLIDIQDIAKLFDRLWGPPCDYGFDSEEVIDVILENTDYNWCERNCNTVEYDLCWEQYIKAKLKEVQNG
jgi:hypothetical protein